MDFQCPEWKSVLLLLFFLFIITTNSYLLLLLLLFIITIIELKHFMLFWCVLRLLTLFSSSLQKMGRSFYHCCRCHIYHRFFACCFWSHLQIRLLWKTMYWLVHRDKLSNLLWAGELWENSRRHRNGPQSSQDSNWGPSGCQGTLSAKHKSSFILWTHITDLNKIN